MKMSRPFLRSIFCLSLAMLLVAISDSAGCTETAAQQNNQIQITDTTPGFWKYWDNMQGKNDQEKVQLFFDYVIDAYPDLYQANVLGKEALTGHRNDEKINADVLKYLHAVEPYVPRMKIISTEIGKNLDLYAKDFALTFPKYAPKTPIYFMVSLFGFDGGTRTINDKTALLFGIDGIARFHQEGESLKVLFDHELFHQYHDQIAPDLTGDEAPIWSRLWEEGLATYVSRQMNKDSSEAQALMSTTLPDAAKPKLAVMARELADNADSTDQKEYAAFFHMNNGRQDVPPRGGYYVGYKVAQQLGSTRTLNQLAELHGDELKQEILKALRQMAEQT